MCENIIENLISKNDKFSCAYADKIISESSQANKWYKYFDEFSFLLEHPIAFILILPAICGMTGVWMAASATEIITAIVSVLLITKQKKMLEIMAKRRE